MDNPVVIALVVSGVGMLLLFVALTLLYGLMYLMTWATNATEPVKDQSEGIKDGKAAHTKRRVALIAVSLARAEQDSGPVGVSEALGAEGPTANWQVFHHQRQLTRNIPPRRAK
jgi:Na+-transporting methylmalonyl-CoA/oxaloacetate decarboxylase gamma subunit